MHAARKTGLQTALALLSIKPAKLGSATVTHVSWARLARSAQSERSIGFEQKLERFSAFLLLSSQSLWRERNTCATWRAQRGAAIFSRKRSSDTVLATARGAGFQAWP